MTKERTAASRIRAITTSRLFAVGCLASLRLGSIAAIYSPEFY